MFRTVVNFESSRYIRDLSMVMLCKKNILFYYSAEALLFCHKYFTCPLMKLLKIQFLVISMRLMSGRLMLRI